MNSYNSLIYIAFFERFGLGLETCQTDDDEYCIKAIQISLATIFATQIIYNNSMELLYPFWHKFKANEVIGDKKLGFPEKNYYLYKSDDTFSDYDELLVTYGYTTLFVLAFPLSPFLALLSFLIELKIDSYKLHTLCRRPPPRSTDSIGVWYVVIEILNLISIFTNLTMILFVSGVGESYWPDMSDRFCVFIALEHLMLIFKGAAAYVIPDATKAVRIERMRHKHIEEVLIDNKLEEFNDPTLQDSTFVRLAMNQRRSQVKDQTYEQVLAQNNDYDQHVMEADPIDRNIGPSRVDVHLENNCTAESIEEFRQRRLEGKVADLDEIDVDVAEDKKKQ